MGVLVAEGSVKPKAQPTGVLDDAFDRVAALDFEIPNAMVNHAPMACEALATLGCGSAIHEWVERFRPELYRATQPVTPTWGHGFPWRDQLGDLWLLPQW